MKIYSSNDFFLIETGQGTTLLDSIRQIYPPIRHSVANIDEWNAESREL